MPAMFFLIGLAVVIGSVLGGYLPHGDARVLWQPLEFLIIMGAALGSFIIANPKPVIMGTMKRFGRLMKGPPHSKAAYVELLTLLYTLFKLAKSKGALALEQHVEKPEESSVFQQYPKFMHNHHAVEFLCDYLRLLTMGSENSNELEDLMNKDIETHHKEEHAISGAITTMSDGMPAFGIVAAVLGVIVTMGSISEPPEVLGKLIGAALVGTFAGVLMAYGVFGPIGKNLEQWADADGKYYECIKAGILAHTQGYAPQISVEFARKTLLSHERPSFAELEEAVNSALPA
jgi:chemotaxis protein MotA